MILNQKFLKEILVPASEPKSKIEEMIRSCRDKKIDVKNIEKEDLNIFHYTIIGSGTEYVLNHLKFIGKPPLKYHALSNFKMDYKSKDKEVENIVESYPELLFSLLEILDEAFMKRTEESENSPGYQSIMHLQNIILNNLFKIIINCFRYLKTAECNYFLYLKIINDCCQTYFQKNKKDPMKFKPLIPIMIEHLMHIRKEMGKNKELNVIMLNLPIGVKHLFESMLNIFDFIQESFQNKDENSGMKILTFLIRVVSNMNDIIDPVIVPQLPQFSKDLFDAFRSSYMKKDQALRPASGRRQDQEAAKEDICGTMFWILGKLGKKCRIYNDMKIFEYKKETINGIKMLFVERDFEEGKCKNVFTSFSISPIGQPYNYPDSVEHILEFLTPCLLFNINKNSMDCELVKRCIKNVLESKDNSKIFHSSNKPRKYSNSDLYDEDPKLKRNMQIRSLELIIRMLFASCLIESKKKPEKIYKDIIKRIKDLTRHFVLLYICKNGRLVNKVDNDFCPEELELLASEDIEVGSNSFLKMTLTEINPLIFIDIVCEFLMENYQSSNLSENNSSTTDSKIVLNEIFSLLKSFYPDPKDYVKALENLEFIDILIKKICYLCYSDTITTKLGCISAIRVLIHHCPVEFLKNYNLKIIDCQIVIIKNMLLSNGGLPNKVITNILITLAKKNNYFMDDPENMKDVVKKVFDSFKEVNCKGRRILEKFMDCIRKAHKNKHAAPVRRKRRIVKLKPDPFPSVYESSIKELSDSVLKETNVTPRKVDLLLEGYSQIDSLINEVDVVLHLFKHNCYQDINPETFSLLISQLVEVLEYEIEIFNEILISSNNNSTVGNNFATKFYLLEKLHVDHNKTHDLFSQTKYPHPTFNLTFEKVKQKKHFKSKAHGIRPESEDGSRFNLKQYYELYLEESLSIKMENRSDYDSYLSELFPNHSQHVEYMILILYLLVQFCQNKHLQDKIKDLGKDNDERKKREEWIDIYKRRIIILMMCCVLRIEEKLSEAAEKNLNSFLEDFEFSERIYEHLETILNEKKISNENYYKEIGIIKLFRILYKKKIDEEKIKKIFGSAVDGIKMVETSVQDRPPGLYTVNHCRFVYEMINIFISVNWFSNNEDNFIRSFDRKVFDIATNMHKKVIKIPCSGSELIDKHSFRDLMCKYMNEKNTWGNHWQLWLQQKRVDILELILEVLNMDESYPFRDRFIRYYDLRILCKDMMSTGGGSSSGDRQVAIYMRNLINKYFNVLNIRIPSAFVNTLKFLELLFSILKERIIRYPESLNSKDNRFICKIILDFFVSFIKYSKNPCTLLLYTIGLYSDCNSFLFEDFNKLLGEYIPRNFSTKKIESLIKGTFKCFERSLQSNKNSFQSTYNVLRCLWVPVFNYFSNESKEKFKEIMDFNFFQKFITDLLHPTTGYVYQWIENKDDDMEIEKPIMEIYKVLALCTQNYDLNKLDPSNKEMLMEFYWRMIKLKYNFKQWHIFTISEFFKNVSVPSDKVKEVYCNILQSNIESGRSRVLQNIAIDNIITQMDSEKICSITETFNYYNQQNENTIMHIADVIIKYEEKFYTDILNYYSDLSSIMKKLLSNCYSNFEKNKIILYLVDVSLKWLKRIIKEHSLPDSTPQNRKFEGDYGKVFKELCESVNICLQKELRIIFANVEIGPVVFLKYLILFRNMHEIVPAYGADNEIQVDTNFSDKDSKEKKLFVLNILNILFNSYLTREDEEQGKISKTKKQEKLKSILKIFFKNICHPCVYSLISEAIPKFAAWAKKDPETKKDFFEEVEKWVTDNIIDVNRTIEEKANDIKESVLYKCLPHLSARILHSLSLEHSDLVDKDLVVKLLWVYRKLQLFLEYYFKTPQAVPGVPEIQDVEFKEKYRGIYFPIDYEIKQEISDLHYSQVTIVYSMKLAAVKVHEFKKSSGISILDDYLKLLDNIITYCKNEKLSLMIYEICECLLQSPKENSLNVKIDLSLNKKGWLACCILKKAVVDTEKNKDRMEEIVTEMLSTHRINNINEMMNCYEYALFFFKPENKKKIQKTFESSFGRGLFTKLRLIFEKVEDQQEFNKMNLPPILMRKIFDAIMSHFDDRIIMCQSNKCMMLRDLSNSDGTDESADAPMSPEGDKQIDSILRNHKNFLDDPQFRDEKEIFKLMMKITNVHDSKYYYHNVKVLLPQVWKTFTKEQKNYLAQSMTNFFNFYSKFLQIQKKKMNLEYETFPNELLEIFQALEPQIVIEPELYSKIATKYNCWVNSILMLEQQLKVVPDYDKYNLILGDLYTALGQDDYYLGKSNTLAIEKSVTYSQFRMWEDVNKELNTALNELYSHSTYSTDLAYANEYDQKIWEEIHSESIVQIGDLDRQKFFSSQMNKYGPFKTEFQKWMVLGKSNNKFSCFDSNKEKLCQEWCSLPRFIDQIHYTKLAKFQESIELNESMALIHSSRSEQKEKYLKYFRTAAMIQRDRIPTFCESHRLCKDILENRYIPFNFLNSSVGHGNRQGDPNDQANKNRFAFKRLLNYIWDKLIITRQARKQNALEVSKRFLVDIELHITRSDEEGLKGISLQNEKYLLIQERMKLVLHYFRNFVRLKLSNDEFLILRKQLITKTINLSEKKVLDDMRRQGEAFLRTQAGDQQNKIQLYPHIWESEIYRLRGEIFMEAKNYDKANEAFLQSLNLCHTSYKNWRSLAFASEQFVEMAEEKKKSDSEKLDWVCTAIEGYLKSLKYNLFNSRLYIIKILDLISTYARIDDQKRIQKSFGEEFKKSQVWVWIFWIPQLLEFAVKSNTEFDIAQRVLCKIAELYPQPTLYTCRHYFWHKAKEPKNRTTSESKSKIKAIGMKIYSTIKSAPGADNLKDVIDLVIRNLQKKFVNTKEEELLEIIEKGYSLSLFHDFKAEKFFSRFWTQMLHKHTGDDFIGKSFRSQFIKDLLDQEDSPEPKIKSYPLSHYQELLKKWKDILSRRLILQGAPQNLVEISRPLANFTYKNGMELPGQYLELDTEPFLSTRILISRFETKVSQNSGKRIIIRTNSGKRLTYAISNNNCRGFDNASKIDERLTQFKVFMNKILMYMHPETMRRGIRFGVYKKIVFPFTKLREDYGINTLDEIYEIACSHNGLDPDTANVLFSRDIKNILSNKMGDTIPDLEESEMNQAVKECNGYMRRLIEDTHLSNYFKNLLKTVDEYFMFRKQFTHYYASNSYMTYIFKLNENNLKNLRVCIEHGRVFHTDLSISYNKDGVGLDNPGEKVPFRLSDNIKELISDIGLKSLFPGVMTTISMASKSKDTFIKSFLRVLFEDDQFAKNNKDEYVDDVMGRILSIGKPYFDRDVSQLRYLNEDPEKKAQTEEQVKKAIHDLKAARFNKKAYDLIKIAGDQETLNQTHPSFVSWY